MLKGRTVLLKGHAVVFRINFEKLFLITEVDIRIRRNYRDELKRFPEHVSVMASGTYQGT